MKGEGTQPSVFHLGITRTTGLKASPCDVPSSSPSQIDAVYSAGEPDTSTDESISAELRMVNEK